MIIPFLTANATRVLGGAEEGFGGVVGSRDGGSKVANEGVDVGKWQTKVGSGLRWVKLRARAL
jgi:hypothetical protein